MYIAPPMRNKKNLRNLLDLPMCQFVTISLNLKSYIHKLKILI